MVMRILSEGVSSKNKALTRGGRIVKYSALSLPAQLAIYNFMAVHGEAWDNLGAPSKSVIAKVVKSHANVKFGYAVIPMARLVRAIETRKESDLYIDFIKDGGTFEDYHKWYIKQGLPSHGAGKRWPVILSGFNEEVIEDGWHRFHLYYKQGAKKIPIIWFP